MTQYRKAKDSGLEATGDAGFEQGKATAFDAWSGKTLGFFGADLGSHAATPGRVPAFLGLAERTGGIYVENPPTVEDALKQTGLDFDVKLEGAQGYYTDMEVGPDGPVEVVKTVDMPHLRTTMAHFHDGRPPVAFTTTSPSYTPLQNTEALSFGQNIADGRLIALGSFGNPVGAKTYAAFRLGEGFSVGGSDQHELFITVINSFDKSWALTGLVAPIRVGCTNQTYATFHGKRVPRFAIRHSSGAQLRVMAAREALGVAMTFRDDYVAQAEGLLKIKITADGFREYAHRVFAVPEAEKLTDRQKKIVAVRDDQLLEILRGATNEGFADTAYGAYQTMVEYSDFFGTVRGEDDAAKAANRHKRIIEGQTEVFKDRAWNLAEALV